ncbi:MAG: hypothetical protein P1U35_13765 [Cycloclasticus sp.]|jgi:hypothetical protein|nr:hypothetical protein [Cycloclasticus sp.]
MKPLTLSLTLLFIAFLSGCSSPGYLEGTWQASNTTIPLIITFRQGETESMGIIEKVDYEQSGDSILVHYKSGMMKGTSFRFLVVDRNTIKSQLGTFKRID